MKSVFINVVFSLMSRCFVKCRVFVNVVFGELSCFLLMLLCFVKCFVFSVNVVWNVLTIRATVFFEQPLWMNPEIHLNYQDILF